MKTNIKTPFGTKEWAVNNLNIINGCSHDCLYCYAKEMAIRFKRKTAGNWKKEVIRKKEYDKSVKKYDGRIMFPTTHDITPEHLNENVLYLHKVLEAKNDVLIVMKPHFICVEKICAEFTFYKKKILFRFTIGSIDDSVLKEWEPNAPSFSERFKSLKLAYERGYCTSVSCEPMLDTNTDKLIDKLKPYVTDAIWVGKANKFIARLKINGHSRPLLLNKAKSLLLCQSEEYIRTLYCKYKSDHKVKWKDSIKQILGLKLPIKIGMDI